MLFLVKNRAYPVQLLQNQKFKTEKQAEMRWVTGWLITALGTGTIVFPNVSGPYPDIGGAPRIRGIILATKGGLIWTY